MPGGGQAAGMAGGTGARGGSGNGGFGAGNGPGGGLGGDTTVSSALKRLLEKDAASYTWRSEEHTSELQSRLHLVCRLLLEKKKKNSRPHSDSYIHHEPKIHSQST